MNDQLYLCIQASFDDLGRKLLTQGRHTSFERCYCRHGGAVKTGGAGLAIGCSPKWRVQIRDIDAASLATTSCRQDDGGEIFIGGTLWKQSTTLPRCTKFRNSQSVLKLTSFPKSWSLFLAGTSCIEKFLLRPGIGLAEHDPFGPVS